jgi:hypothetical protein
MRRWGETTDFPPDLHIRGRLPREVSIHDSASVMNSANRLS